MDLTSQRRAVGGPGSRAALCRLRTSISWCPQTAQIECTPIKDTDLICGFRKILRLTFVVGSLLAPRCRRRSTTAVRPLRAAAWSAVWAYCSARRKKTTLIRRSSEIISKTISKFVWIPERDIRYHSFACARDAYEAESLEDRADQGGSFQNHARAVNILPGVCAEVLPSGLHSFQKDRKEGCFMRPLAGLAMMSSEGQDGGVNDRPMHVMVRLDRMRAEVSAAFEYEVKAACLVPKTANPMPR